MLQMMDVTKTYRIGGQTVRALDAITPDIVVPVHQTVNQPENALISGRRN